MNSVKIKDFALKLCNKGLRPEYSNNKNNSIFTTNAIFLTVVFNLLVDAVLMLAFTNFHWGALGLFTTAIAFQLAVQLNVKGYHLLARVGILIHLCNAVIITACIFSHDTVLFVSLLQTSYICIFLFDKSEQKWALFVVAYAIIWLIIQVSPLRFYLPNYNLLPAEDLLMVNAIYSLGHISHAVVAAMIYLQITAQRENELKKIQSKLIASQRSLLMHNEDLESFSAIAIHDLKSPIYSGLLTLQILEDELTQKKPDNEETTELISDIRTCLTNMEKISIDLLAYSKIMLVDFVEEVIDVQEEIGAIFNTICRNYPNSTITYNLSQRTIKINKLLFLAIMHNLLDNGLKYNTSPTPHIQVELQIEQNKPIFHVIDNGYGISKEISQNLFKPFIIKRPSDTSHKTKGSGLGLSGAKRAADKLNAKLYCHHSDNNGTHFILELNDK